MGFKIIVSNKAQEEINLVLEGLYRVNERIAAEMIHLNRNFLSKYNTCNKEL